MVLRNPVAGCVNMSHSEPRVGASHQLWAGGHSPVGAVKKMGKDNPKGWVQQGTRHKKSHHHRYIFGDAAVSALFLVDRQD